MAIKKQDFYEGAALYLLARSGMVKSVRYEAPFFILNDRLVVYLKYSTKGRSPWAFTFMPSEQASLGERALTLAAVVGLVCGGDGVAALPFRALCSVAPPSTSSIHVSCYRKHGEHYSVCGPEGTLGGKIAPSNWLRILECDPTP